MPPPHVVKGLLRFGLSALAEDLSVACAIAHGLSGAPNGADASPWSWLERDSRRKASHPALPVHPCP